MAVIRLAEDLMEGDLVYDDSGELRPVVRAERRGDRIAVWLKRDDESTYIATYDPGDEVDSE